ncbi:hypothetical protein RHGRI_009103 [Rhododendron griersonianum]|uniref:Ovate family protein n=1 Tax=Rhododendron griersonianum TaxID=479676 RepID=A0AAV6L689_9ERIC|nr:hypothetical protein RHGRI_009103 [Rhododendron griersonianum]
MGSACRSKQKKQRRADSSTYLKNEAPKERWVVYKGGAPLFHKVNSLSPASLSVDDDVSRASRSESASSCSDEFEALYVASSSDGFFDFERFAMGFE